MRRSALVCLLVPLVLAGCSSRMIVTAPSPAPSPKTSGPVAALKIPPGHYPPAGKCRLWYPGRPPGHQPPAASCRSLHGAVPPGAWVLYRPTTEKKVVEVTAYDEAKPGLALWVRFFNAKTGKFVRDGKIH